MNKALSPLLQIGLCTFGYLYATSNTALAQVTTDGTVDTQVNQDGNVSEITGGETRGANLFHSFQDFSVGTGNEAFFNNANDISNIFSRVTGGNISNIDGLIRANGSASLFLINPNGIIFGNNARLDIGGSFYGSTASSILFEGGEFSAADLENPPLLTVNAPIGLGFRDNPGDIINRSVEPNPDGITNAEGEPVGIQVQDGENIGFIGGRILLENGNLTAKGGNIELGSVGGNGQVQINQDADNIIFNYDFIDNFENIRLENSTLDVSAGEDGNISFNAQNINILDGSAVDAGIASGFGSVNSQAGDIVFRATESITISNSFVFNFVSQDGIGNSGNVIVEAESLSINDGAQFGSLTFGQGNAGNVFINTTELVEVVGRPGGLGFLGSSVQSGAEGNAGNLTIDTQSLIVRDGSQLSTSTQGNGNAGNLTINAPNLVELKGEVVDEDGNAQSPGGIFAQIDFRTGSEGTGGNLIINTERLSVSDGSRIQVATFGQGDAGELILNASEIDLFNTGSPRFFTAITAGVLQDPNSATLPIGNGGRLFIETNRLSVRDGARISADVQGEGDGGDILITATDLVEIIGTNENDISSFISAEVAPPGVITPVSPENITGNGGSVIIETRQLDVKNGGRLSVSTFGRGSAGDFSINASDSISINGEGSGLFVASSSEALGEGGNLSVFTDNLNLTNMAEISAVSSFGSGGNIVLNVNDINLRNNSLISARAFEDASGGDLTIDARFIIAFPNGNNDILASAEQGAGGNITINAESLFGIQERTLNDSTNDINANSQVSGLDGTISISTPDINPVQRATELPTNLVTPQQTAQQACEANRESAAKNGLNITGKGGILPEPGLPLNSLNVTVDGESTSAKAIPAPIETSQGKIQPARGIKVTESGEIILTAYRTNNSGERLPEIKRNCKFRT